MRVFWKFNLFENVLTEMVREREELSEEEKRALRGSKFAPLPSLATSSSRSQPRFQFLYIYIYISTLLAVCMISLVLY